MADFITEDWLRGVGFKWHQLERQSQKQWLLWLGSVVYKGQMFHGCDDLGIEVANNPARDTEPEYWNCWLRGDYSHRYSRFIHVRQVHFQNELIALIEAITSQPFDSQNNINGSMVTPDVAARIRVEEEKRSRRLDVQFLRPTWRDIEKDDSRGRPLPEHLQAAEDARLKGK